MVVCVARELTVRSIANAYKVLANLQSAVDGPQEDQGPTGPPLPDILRNAKAEEVDKGTLAQASGVVEEALQRVCIHWRRVLSGHHSGEGRVHFLPQRTSESSQFIMGQVAVGPAFDVGHRLDR